jgi:hypothetical protein
MFSMKGSSMCSLNYMYPIYVTKNYAYILCISHMKMQKSLAIGIGMALIMNKVVIVDNGRALWFEVIILFMNLWGFPL